MWLFFGFFTFLSFAFYSLFKYIDSHWLEEYTTYKHNNLNQSCLKSYNNILKKWRYGFKTHSSNKIDFAIKRKNFFDSLFKKIGLNIHLFEQDSLVEDFYIVSDNTKIIDLIKKNEVLQTNLKKIFLEASKGDFTLSGIYYRRKKLWIEIKGDDKNFSETIYIPLITKISNEIDKYIIDLKTKAKDNFIPKAIAVLSISTAFSFSGIIYYTFPTLFDFKPYYFNSTGLITLSFVFGTIFILCFLYFVWEFLDKQSRSKLILLEILTIGYFGAWSVSYILISNFNTILDSSKPEIIQTKILDKTTYINLNSETVYYLYFQNIDKNRPISEVRVSENIYNSFDKDYNAYISVSKGFFGLKWIKEVSYLKDKK